MKIKVEIEIRTLVEAYYALKMDLPRARKNWTEAKNNQNLDQRIREQCKQVHRDSYITKKKAIAEINSLLEQ